MREHIWIWQIYNCHLAVKGKKHDNTSGFGKCVTTIWHLRRKQNVTCVN